MNRLFSFDFLAMIKMQQHMRILLILLLVAGLSGCSSNSDAQNTTPTDQKTSPNSQKHQPTNEPDLVDVVQDTSFAPDFSPNPLPKAYDDYPPPPPSTPSEP